MIYKGSRVSYGPRVLRVQHAQSLQVNSRASRGLGTYLATFRCDDFCDANVAKSNSSCFVKVANASVQDRVLYGKCYYKFRNVVYRRGASDDQEAYRRAGYFAREYTRNFVSDEAYAYKGDGLRITKFTSMSLAYVFIDRFRDREGNIARIKCVVSTGSSVISIATPTLNIS